MGPLVSSWQTSPLLLLQNWGSSGFLFVWGHSYPIYCAALICSSGHTFSSLKQCRLFPVQQQPFKQIKLIKINHLPISACTFLPVTSNKCHIFTCYIVTQGLCVCFCVHVCPFQVPSASRCTSHTTWQAAGCWEKVFARCGWSWTTCSAPPQSSTLSSLVMTASYQWQERWVSATHTHTHTHKYGRHWCLQLHCSHPKFSDFNVCFCLVTLEHSLSLLSIQ